MIEVIEVSKRFKEKEVLHNISLRLEQGKIYGLIGRNGSGKTMLMKCICGFVQPTSGKILFDGKQLGKDMDFAPETGVIIETPGFVKYQSGMENLSNLAAIRRKTGKEKMVEVMRQVGLDPDSKLKVGKYSLGMRQRLGIAQAIMEDPDTLILDEPMNGLDNQGVEDVRNLLLDLKAQGKTILIASHNREDIDVLCDHVWKMNQGEMSQVR